MIGGDVLNWFIKTVGIVVRITSMRFKISDNEFSNEAMRTVPFIKFIKNLILIFGDIFRSATRYYFFQRGRLGKSKSFVSVIMPVYNRKDVFIDAVLSVLSQKYKNYELIIVNDGSEDYVEKALYDNFSDHIKEGRIRYIFQANTGVCRARNRGIEASRGDIIAYLDSDNLWSPFYLSEIVFRYSNDCNLKMLYTKLNVFDYRSGTAFFRNTKFNYFNLLRGNYIDLNVFSHRRVLYDIYGGFDESMTRVVDYDLIVRYSKFEEPDFLNLGLCHYFYRSSGDQITYSECSEKNLKILYQKHKAKKKGVVYIKCPCPDATEALSWGDYALAVEIGKECLKKGFDLRLDFLKDWEKPHVDGGIVFVLRGISYFDVSGCKTQKLIMWNYSHPDKISLEEYLSYDEVLVGSRSHARFLGEKGLDALYVPQFSYVEFGGEEDFSRVVKDKVLFVGNSRGEFRQSIQCLVENDISIPFEVVGKGWGEFIDKPVLCENIPYYELANYYNKALFVLNDHWGSMKDYGFISNRILDVISAGGLVISDKFKELEEDFEGKIPTFESPQDILNHFNYLNSNPREREKLISELRIIVEQKFSKERTVDQILGRFE